MKHTSFKRKSPSHVKWMEPTVYVTSSPTWAQKSQECSLQSWRQATSFKGLTAAQIHSCLKMNQYRSSWIWVPWLCWITIRSEIQWPTPSPPTQGIWPHPLTSHPGDLTYSLTSHPGDLTSPPHLPPRGSDLTPTPPYLTSTNHIPTSSDPTRAGFQYYGCVG